MSVPDSILALHSYESLYELIYQKLIKRGRGVTSTVLYVRNYVPTVRALLYDAIDLI